MLGLVPVVAVVVVLPVVAAGCYSTAIVPAGAVRRAGAPAPPAEAPLGVVDLGGGKARLGPRSEVRIRRRDGSASRWYSAGELMTSGEGLGTAATLPLGAATRALVRDGGAAMGGLLAATAPSGGVFIWQGEGFALQAPGPGKLAVWAAAASARSLDLGGAAGMWRFARPEGGWLSAGIHGTTLAATPEPALATRRLAEGTAWPEIAALEIRSFDPFLSVASGLGVTGVAMLALVLGGDPGGPISEAREGVDKSAMARDDPQPHVAMLLPPEAAAPTDGRPLFSARARRRALIKLVVSGDVGLSQAGSGTGGGGLGLRLFDFVDVTARLRAVTSGADEQTRLLAGGRLALHVDSDAQPLTALTMGFELFAGSTEGGSSLLMVSLPVGPRVSFGGGGGVGFASLLLSPGLVYTGGALPDRQRATAAQVVASLELGLAL
jgi:hypothetical protein